MDDLAALLSEALDLCVRARRLDEDSLAFEMDSFAPDPVMPRSATVPLWVTAQYETDLADWEKRARARLAE